MLQRIPGLLHNGAILLDCDGTIAEMAEEAHVDCVGTAVERVVKDAGLQFSRIVYDQIWEQELGKGILNFLEVYRSTHKSSARLMPTASEIEAQYEEIYVQFATDVANRGYYRMHRGFVELFKTAAANGVPVAAVSNAKQRVLNATLSACIREEGIDNPFAVIVGVDAFSARGYAPKGKEDEIGRTYKGTSYDGGIEILQERLEADYRRATEPSNSASRNPPKKIIHAENCIGGEDTAAGLEALLMSNVGRVIFFNNKASERDVIEGPDDRGVIQISPFHSVMDAIRGFAAHPEQKEGSPRLTMIRTDRALG